MWHLAVLLVVAAGYESLFLRHGISLIDEGWTLYAAMRLHGGGTLYRDVLFVFPPGHLLAAWIAWGVDPPGITVARAFYSAFNVAACAAVYLLGRRLMPPSWALLAALLLAVAAPLSHLTHHLFGYRYLVFSALALLAFAERLRTGDARWLFAAGALTGVALCFRITPAVAAACGVAVGILASTRDPRGWLSDGARFALALVLVAGPVFGWLVASVGPETLWREIAVRPVVMTERQSLPLPELALPSEWSRAGIADAFVALQFRVFPLLYLVYGGVLAVGWLRAVRSGRAFERTLLLAVVVWGGVYFFRTQGRSDFGHLESALPPVCLLLAHALHAGFAAVEARVGGVPSRWRAVGVGALALCAWIFLSGSDRALDAEWRGTNPLVTSGGATSLAKENWTHNVDLRVETLRSLAAPGETVLDLSSSPLLYVLSNRLGPGWFDIVMPATFLDEREEAAFVELLEREPPALVVWPIQPFDRLPERGATKTAPRLLRWVARNYEYVSSPELAIARPRDRPVEP